MSIENEEKHCVGMHYGMDCSLAPLDSLESLLSPYLPQ